MVRQIAKRSRFIDETAPFPVYNNITHEAIACLSVAG